MIFLKTVYLALVLLILSAGCSTFGEKVEVGDTVTVSYTGRLEDGKVFDTNVREVAEDPVTPKASIFRTRRVYTPLKFKVGEGSVIQGFEDAVIGMKTGEEKEVSIPPDKGYGEWTLELAEPYPRIQIVDVIEEVPMDELANETGIMQFVKNETIPWRYWKARILVITPELVILKNEVSDTTMNTEFGTLDIKVDTGTITMMFTPIIDSVVTTMEGPYGPPRFSSMNETNFIIDFNHPLAGKTLNFRLKLESIEKVSG